VQVRPGLRKNTGRGQLGSIAGKSSIGEEAAPSMPIPLDLCSTEVHGHYLQNEAARKRIFTLRPSDAPVKSENGKAVVAGGNQNHVRRFHFLFSKATIYLSDWTWLRMGRRHRSNESDHAPRL